MKNIALSDIAKHLGAEVFLKGQKIPENLIAQLDLKIEKIASLDQATEKQISFLSNPKYANLLPNTRAGAVIISPEALSLLEAVSCYSLLVKDPYLGFAKTAQLFAPEPNAPVGIHPTAVISPTANISSSASIGPNVVIGDRAQIAEKVKILANVVIGDDVIIGAGSLIYPNVSIYYGTVLGAENIIHSGAVIGSDGFGLAKDPEGRWVKIPQLGNVVMGSRVEVGANSTIDRGALGDTRIHDDVKIDNLVHLGHNVEVGENTALAAHVGVSGSVKIGSQCILAGKVGVAGHLEIGNGIILTGATNVSKSILAPGVYSSGIPAKPQKEWARILAQMTRLDKLQRKFLELEKRVKKES
jgi:UDP-3-O-[3-hydroxymyristoyl] glucosamine N-acyltransferase